MIMLLYILCQLYLTLWNLGWKSECTPFSLFLITPPSKKINIYKPSFYLVLTTTSHSSRRSQKNKKKSTLATKMVRKIISLNVEKNLESWVPAYMSRAPRWSGQTFWYLYEFVLRANMYDFSYMEGITWAFHAGLYACLYRTITYIPSLNCSFSFQKLTNIHYRSRSYDPVLKYNKGRVSLCSHQAVKISW